MRFKVDEIEVLFPYKYIYPEQFAYMFQLKRSIDQRGHSVLEMSSGTGKTVTILSLLLAYYLHHPAKIDSIIYCSRTVPELNKTVEELKRIVKYYKKTLKKELKITAVALSARKNMCINPEVLKEFGDKAVDYKCYNLTAQSIRDRAQNDPSVPVCPFFENVESTSLPFGVYDLDDLREFGRQNGVCPYFLARNILSRVQIVVFSYAYLLDPHVASQVAGGLSKNSVVVFDEAHNIDNVCIEALSIEFSRKNINQTERSLEALESQLELVKQTDANLLRAEYERLVSNIQAQRRARQSGTSLTNPLFPELLLEEAVPGNIRQAEHFLHFLLRFLNYVKYRMESDYVIKESIQVFTNDLKKTALIDSRPLKFCASRLSSMIETLSLGDIENLQSILKLTRLASLLVQEESTGFVVVIEPAEYSEKSATIDNKLTLCCLDATKVTKAVFERFQSIVLTSGTLVPIDMYPRILNFNAGVMTSLGMTQTRASVCPMIVTHGGDQVTLSTRYECRDDIDIIRNYGLLLAELSSAVPDGIACFFTSYDYMEKVVSIWQEQGFIDRIMHYKLIFVETVSGLETRHALMNYRKACDNGRGAVLLSVARGKVSEGIDFENHYGRTVVMYGVPYVYTQSRILAARLEYLRDHFNIMESEFLTFDAMRHTAQCVGRILRGKTDYGVIIFADFRFAREDKKSKLPAWILENLSDSMTDLSIDEAVQNAKHFLKIMSVPVKLEDQLGTSLLTGDDVNCDLIRNETLEKMGVEI